MGVRLIRSRFASRSQYQRQNQFPTFGKRWSSARHKCRLLYQAFKQKRLGVKEIKALIKCYLPVKVKVWGEYACFTRPEFGVERVSYDVMTPSAARGILQAIFWKPEMAWRVRKIHVLAPIRHISLRRNETKSVQSERTARRWAEKRQGHYYANRDVAQRQSLFLRDVAYLITADIALQPYAQAHIAKYRDQFRRRVARGQSFTTPYLGTRECSAFFGPPAGTESSIEKSTDLGLMLFDVLYTDDPEGPLEYRRHSGSVTKVVRGRAEAAFFHARLERGVLSVPDLYAPFEPAVEKRA